MRNPNVVVNIVFLYILCKTSSSFSTSYVYLAKIPINELTNDAATKDDAAITTNFNILVIDYCDYYSTIRTYAKLPYFYYPSAPRVAVDNPTKVHNIVLIGTQALNLPILYAEKVLDHIMD
jgi:hypothetical protein